MKSFLSFLGIGWLSLVGCVCVAVIDVEGGTRSEKAVARRHRTGAIPAATQKVIVENHSGPVTIEGATDNFGWEWDLACEADHETVADKSADRCKLEVSQAGQVFRMVFTPPKTSGRNSPGIESVMRLRVPKTTAVEVENRFGGIEVVRIGGRVKVRNQSGSVTLKSIAGELDAGTSFARMTAEDIGPAVLQNQSGAIEAGRVAGDFTATTSFGALSVHNVKGTVELKNQSGAINVENIAGQVKARTSFAAMRVKDTGPANLASQSGSIEAVRVAGDVTAATSFNNLSVQDIRGQADLSNQSGAISAQGIAGSIKARTSFAKMNLCGTGSTISAHNQSGSIEIDAPSDQTARIDADTSFASLLVSLPAKSKPAITAATSFAKVQSDFPLGKKDLQAEAGPDIAAPIVTLKNQSGGIQIRKLPSP